METSVYQLNLSIFHNSLDLLISSVLNNNNNNNNNNNKSKWTCPLLFGLLNHLFNYKYRCYFISSTPDDDDDDDYDNDNDKSCYYYPDTYELVLCSAILISPKRSSPLAKSIIIFICLQVLCTSALSKYPGVWIPFAAIQWKIIVPLPCWTLPEWSTDFAHVRYFITGFWISMSYNSQYPEM